MKYPIVLINLISVDWHKFVEYFLENKGLAGKGREDSHFKENISSMACRSELKHPLISLSSIVLMNYWSPFSFEIYLCLKYFHEIFKENQSNKSIDSLVMIFDMLDLNFTEKINSKKIQKSKEMIIEEKIDVIQKIRLK